MPYDILLVIIAILITMALLLLKTNSAVVFFAVCAGSVLAIQLGEDAALLSSVVIKNSDISKAVAEVSLVILPSVLSAIFMRGSIKGAKFIFNILPAIATSALLIILIVPFLPVYITKSVLDSQPWIILQKYQPVVLTGGIVSSILLLFINHSSGKKVKKHKK